jgi:hypothetical protein
MATVAQIAANRLNARKSTGPKTPAGKHRSARNAVKWGLFSQHVLLNDQDDGEWEELSFRIRALLQPTDGAEELLVDEIIANWFRLARCLKIDGGLFRAYSTYQGQACGLGTAFAQAAQLDCFGKLSRYEQHLERKLALSLQRLHSVRRARPEATRPAGERTLLEAPHPEETNKALPPPISSPSGSSQIRKESGWRLIIARVAAKWRRRRSATPLPANPGLSV